MSVALEPKSFEDKILDTLLLFEKQVNAWLPLKCPNVFTRNDIHVLFLYLMTPESWYSSSVSTVFYSSHHFNAVIGGLQQKSIGDGLCAIWASVIDQVDFPETGDKLIQRRYRSCAILRAMSIVQSGKIPSTWTETLDDGIVSDILSLFKRNLRVTGNIPKPYVLKARKDIKHFGRRYYTYILDQVMNDVSKQVDEDFKLAEEMSSHESAVEEALPDIQVQNTLWENDWEFINEKSIPCEENGSYTFGAYIAQKFRSFALVK